MRRTRAVSWLTPAAALALVSCGLIGDRFIGPPVETRFSFVNFSRTAYAAIGVRDHAAPALQAGWPGRSTGAAEFTMLPLLAPGAIVRADFRDLVSTGCPEAVDFRLLIYQRANDDVPIGLDPGEAVQPAPVVAGEILGLPACEVQPVVTYTVVNWDAPDGTARVKIAQSTAIDDQIRASGLFPNTDAAWEVVGVDPALSGISPPPPGATEPIAGRVTLPTGEGVAGIGVLLRTRFRVRLDDEEPANDPDAGFSDPIAFATTDASGAFSIDRPAGGYQIEFFADEFTFRPASVLVESPIEVVQIIAEPL